VDLEDFSRFQNDFQGEGVLIGCGGEQ
jgi:hypothetical protein